MGIRGVSRLRADLPLCQTGLCPYSEERAEEHAYLTPLYMLIYGDQQHVLDQGCPKCGSRAKFGHQGL